MIGPWTVFVLHRRETTSHPFPVRRPRRHIRKLSVSQWVFVLQIVALQFSSVLMMFFFWKWMKTFCFLSFHRKSHRDIVSHFWANIEKTCFFKTTTIFHIATATVVFPKIQKKHIFSKNSKKQLLAIFHNAIFFTKIKKNDFFAKTAKNSYFL